MTVQRLEPKRASPSMLILDGIIGVGFLVLCLWADAAAIIPTQLSPLTLVTLLMMSVAVGIIRLTPSGALGLAWVSSLLYLSSGTEVSLQNAGVLAVLYGSAAFGSRITVWLGAAAALIGAVVATLYLVFTGSLALRLLPYTSGTPYMVHLALFGFFVAGMLALPWLIGMLVRAVGGIRRAWNARENADSAAEQSRQSALAEAENARQAQLVARAESEKSELARDMHDIVGHSLAVIIAQSDALRYLLRSEPGPAATAAENIGITARRSLADVREVLQRLDRGEVSGRAAEDIDQLIEHVASTGVAIESTVDGIPVPLDEATMMVVYRTVQEMLTNALKHAKPGEPIRLSRSWRDGLLVVSSSNDADGAPDRSSGLPGGQIGGRGIDGMRIRVAERGGSVDAYRAYGVYTIQARIPIPSQPAPPPAMLSGAAPAVPARHGGQPGDWRQQAPTASTAPIIAQPAASAPHNPQGPQGPQAPQTRPTEQLPEAQAHREDHHPS